jgi:uncharacterized protein YjbI with pentapeptide repeats
MTRALLKEAKFDNCYTTKLNMHLADLTRATFNKTHLAQAVLVATLVGGTTWRDTDMQEVDMSGLDLSLKILSGLNFSRAKLCGVKMFGTELKGTNLTGADLSNADLDNTKMSDAIVSEAVMVGAKLTAADCALGMLSITSALSRANRPLQLNSPALISAKQP